ncbi:MAG: ankyrin repeat domain-containing protein [Nannocystaceae bacterium]
MPDLDERRREALRQAVQDDDVDEVRRLLAERPIDVDDDLVIGVCANAVGNYEVHADLLRALIEGGASADVCEHDFRTTPLMLAADAGDLEMIELLLERDADPTRVNQDGETALVYALREGHLRAAERLAAASSVALEPEMLVRCFIGAAEHGRSAIVRELLGERDGVRLGLDRGHLLQAFKGACAARDPETLEVLRPQIRPPPSRMELGEGLRAALVNVRVLDDEETLARRRAVVFSLLQAGADPEIAEPIHGSSALFFAQEPAIVGALLDAGASPNRRRNDGVTPFILAAGRLDLPVMSLLLERGADPHARDLFGRNAAAHAERASAAPNYAKVRDLLGQRRVEPQRWSDEAHVGRAAGDDWLSIALFAFAIAGIIFGVAVLRCTAE